MTTRRELVDAYAFERGSGPRMRMNFVASLDGAATLDGRSAGLGSDDDQLVMSILRMMADAIVVGAGTVRAEGYGGVAPDAAARAWRVEHDLEPVPPLVIVSRSANLERDLEVFTEAARQPIVVTTEAASATRRGALDAIADVVVAGADDVDLTRMSEALADRGLRHLLCEGGPHLHGALLDADLVDELCLSLGSLLVGGDGRRITQGANEATHRMRLVHAIPADEVLLLRYARA